MIAKSWIDLYALHSARPHALVLVQLVLVTKIGQITVDDYAGRRVISRSKALDKRCNGDLKEIRLDAIC